jgi:hypothetical protein
MPRGIKNGITITLRDIIVQRRVCYLKQRFGDCILLLFSGGTYQLGPEQRTSLSLPPCLS